MLEAEASGALMGGCLRQVQLISVGVEPSKEVLTDEELPMDSV